MVKPSDIGDQKRRNEFSSVHVVVFMDYIFKGKGQFFFFFFFFEFHGMGRILRGKVEGLSRYQERSWSQKKLTGCLV